MSDLLAFLNARLDEDERYLDSNRSHLWTQRPLREVTAKRAIIRAVFDYEATIDGEWGCGHSADDIAAGRCDSPDQIEALRVLAAVYDDHPDYRTAWAPEGGDR